MVLRADGTFDQHITLIDGRKIDVSAQRWQYNEEGGTRHIALDRRLEFFVPEHTHAAVGGGKSAFEVLLVEFDPEPVILLHPDSDCLYTKTKAI
jgi:hypothetical protein